MNSLPKTVTRQRRGCDMNPGPSAPESSTLTTRLPSHPCTKLRTLFSHGALTILRLSVTVVTTDKHKDTLQRIHAVSITLVNLCHTLLLRFTNVVVCFPDCQFFLFFTNVLVFILLFLSLLCHCFKVMICMYVCYMLFNKY